MSWKNPEQREREKKNHSAKSLKKLGSRVFDSSGKDRQEHNERPRQYMFVCVQMC